MDVRGKTGMKQDTVTAAKLLYERQASFVLCNGQAVSVSEETAELVSFASTIAGFLASTNLGRW